MEAITDPLVTRKQAAILLGGVNRVTLFRWEKSGRLPQPIRISPRVVGYRLSVIEALLRAGSAA